MSVSTEAGMYVSFRLLKKLVGLVLLLLVAAYFLGYSSGKSNSAPRLQLKPTTSNSQ
jgi:hypothetical protein